MPDITTAKQALKKLSSSVDTQKLQEMDAVLLFDLTGEDEGEWTVTIADGKLSVAEGRAGDPTVTLAMDARDLASLVDGTLNPVSAFMQGRIKIKGDMSTAMRLQNLFG